MQKWDSPKIWSIFLFLTFFCAPCAPAPTAPTTIPPEATNPSRLLPTGTSTVDPSQTSTPINTVTQHLTPTSIPVPTLSEEEIHQVEDFIQGTEKCQLPCWNGITPGISKGIQATEIFSRLGIDSQELQPFTLESGNVSITELFVLKDYKKPTKYLSGVYVEWSDLQIKVIGLFYSGAYPDFFSIDALLDKFGTEPEVQVNVAFTEGGPLYSIYMNFPEINTALTIESTWMRTNEICSIENELAQLEVFSYAPGIDITNYALTSELWADPEHYTGLSAEDFLQKLRNPNTCIPFDY